MHILAIDPGKNTGWATFIDGRLTDCGLGIPPYDQGFYYHNWPFDQVVIERPVIYPNQKARPEDVLSVAFSVGRYQERYNSSQVVLVKPAEWKGNVPKKIHNRRVLASLQPGERQTLEDMGLCETKAHNVIDAIGLGKWFIAKGINLTR